MNLKRYILGSFLVLALLIAISACQSPNTSILEAQNIDTQPTDVPKNPEPKQVIPAPPPPAPLLLVLPMGKFPVDEMKVVTGAIEEYYGWRTEVLVASKLPKEAWYKPRKRYRAEILLDWIKPKLRDDATRIMGVTEEDISTTKGKHKDWGICGLAEMGGTASVVSSYRIKRGLNRFPKKDRHSIYLKRLAELTAHEFGHNLGLPHCPNVGCIMEDAKGTVNTFNHSTGKLCDLCKDLLRD